MPEELRAYIAGFLDGDGCIMAQLVKRSGYRYGYQIRLSIVFYQKSRNRHFLEWLKTKLKYGYVRNRNDGMSEYTIVGKKEVADILRLLKTHLHLKKQLATKIIEISKMIKYPKIRDFLKFCQLVDKTAKYTYSKKRKITTAQVKKYLEEHKLFSP
ncbi:MAG: site-specific DNA endonuclease [Promethearchaeota archaeon CR_4]|nr:MAG: site-specific DNA endonuclease [Candidatus Lokiarchaeota archaeon CR_4]